MSFGNFPKFVLGEYIAKNVVLAISLAIFSVEGVEGVAPEEREVALVKICKLPLMSLLQRPLLVSKRKFL